MSDARPLNGFARRVQRALSPEAQRRAVSFADLAKNDETLLQILDAPLRAMAARIATLEAKINEVESRGVRYLGSWQASADYRRGDLTTYGGSMWCANQETREQPGTSKAWTLAVKRGADGKDAR